MALGSSQVRFLRRVFCLAIVPGSFEQEHNRKCNTRGSQANTDVDSMAIATQQLLLFSIAVVMCVYLHCARESKTKRDTVIHLRV